MEFKLPKFTLTLKEDLKIRDWEVNYVHAGRKEKVCNSCGIKIGVGASATTFVKRITTIRGDHSYETKYTCGGKNSNCTKETARRLQVELP